MKSNLKFLLLIIIKLHILIIKIEEPAFARFLPDLIAMFLMTYAQLFSGLFKSRGLLSRSPPAAAGLLGCLNENDLLLAEVSEG